MSYCINCGVKLQKYHKKCVLCDEVVASKDKSEVIENHDYPQRKTNPIEVNKKAARILAVVILLTVLVSTSVISLLIDLMINQTLTWSLIVAASIFTGIAAGYTILERRHTFFKKFINNSILSSVYLIVLNWLAAGSISWAVYPIIGLALTVIIMAGFLKKEEISRVMPVIVYYILSFLLVFATAFFAINSKLIVFNLILPTFAALLISTIVMYFVSQAAAGDPMKIVIAFLGYISVLTILVDVIISKYLEFSAVPSWSYNVLLCILPVIAICVIVKKSSELRMFMSKKLHR